MLQDDDEPDGEKEQPENMQAYTGSTAARHGYGLNHEGSDTNKDKTLIVKGPTCPDENVKRANPLTKVKAAMTRKTIGAVPSHMAAHRGSWYAGSALRKTTEVYEMRSDDERSVLTLLTYAMSYPGGY